MICFLFAAGNGIRLRPVTEEIQKCLLPVGGKPMLEWWLEAIFDSMCFEKVFVNVHYCARQVESWLASYMMRTGNIVTIIDESKQLLGTAGTLFWHADTEQEFMLAYTDTYSENFMKNITESVANFRQFPGKFVAGVVSFPPPGDGSAGTMSVEPDGSVVGFNEKDDGGEYAWAGIMFGRPEFFNFIMESDRDLAHDVLPRLAGRMRVVSHVDAYDMGRGIEYYEYLNRRLLKTSKRKA